MFEADARPFAMVYWSRDPDATQHNQGDSLNELFPGINGPSSHHALRNADNNLKQLLGWLDAHPSIKANTDVFVTSDHGFATVSRREIDRTGKTSSAESAQHVYLDGNGRVDTERGTLPPGFLAVDLAFDFKLNLFDSDRRVLDGGRNAFHAVRMSTSDAWEHPNNGSGFLGQIVEKVDGSDARIIVAANGGSDLIYVPDGNPDLVQRICARALAYDYVSAVFVDDAFGKIAGTLPTSLLGFQGKSAMPRPAMVVVFKTFYLNADDIQTAAQISDSSLQEGQGQHGGFGRECTFNAMAAWGPDFKAKFADAAPVSNADITPTLAHVLGFDLPSVGELKGRVMAEALTAAPAAASAPLKYISSDPFHGARTAFYYEELGGERYGAAACRVPADRQDPSSIAVCRQ
jgi:arylsulfatase A-like enzyme